jgi:hypothetical protein
MANDSSSQRLYRLLDSKAGTCQAAVTADRTGESAILAKELPKGSVFCMVTDKDDLAVATVTKPGDLTCKV